MVINGNKYENTNKICDDAKIVKKWHRFLYSRAPRRQLRHYVGPIEATVKVSVC